MHAALPCAALAPLRPPQQPPLEWALNAHLATPAATAEFEERGPPQSRFDAGPGGGSAGGRGGGRPPMRDRVVGGDLAYHAAHGVAALLDAPLPPGAPADQITHLLARRSRAELYEYLSQMQGALQRNPGQARAILADTPALAKALLQMQVILGMVGNPLGDVAPKGIAPPNLMPRHEPLPGAGHMGGGGGGGPPGQQQQQQHDMGMGMGGPLPPHMQQGPPPHLGGMMPHPQQQQPYAAVKLEQNGGGGGPMGPPGYQHGYMPPPTQQQQQQPLGYMPAEPGYGMMPPQQQQQQQGGGPVDPRRMAAAGPRPMLPMAPPPQQQQPVLTAPAMQQQQAAPLPAPSGGMSTDQQQGELSCLECMLVCMHGPRDPRVPHPPLSSLHTHLFPSTPLVALHMFAALLQQVMSLTPQQIELLPQQQKAQVLALQQQLRGGQ